MIGFIAVNIYWIISKRFKLSDVDLVKRIDLTSSLIKYGIHLILVNISTGMLRELTQIISIRDNLTNAPWWLYVWMVMEFLMLYNITSFQSSERVKKNAQAQYLASFNLADLSKSQVGNIFGIKPGTLDKTQSPIKSSENKDSESPNKKDI